MSSPSAQVNSVEETLQLFQATFEQAAVGITHVSLEGKFIRLNQKICEIAGYPRDEMMQLNFQDITHPEDLEADLSQMQELLAGVQDHYKMEKRYCRKDGSIVWVMLTVTLVRYIDGAPHYFIAVVEDISERKKLELAHRKVIEELAKTQLLYSNLLASISDAVFLVDDIGKFVYVCPNVANIFGYSKTDVLEMGTIDKILGSSFIGAIDLNLVKSCGEITNQECQILDSTGKAHDLLVNIKSVQLNPGTVLYTCRDVTNRKQAADELKLYERIANTTQDLMAFLDRDYRYHIVNEAYAQRFGRSQSALVGQSKVDIVGQTSTDIVGVETFEKVVKPNLDRCFAGEDVHYRDWFNFADGQPHYLDVAYSPYRSPEQEITGVVVSARDITPLQKAEDELKLYEQIANTSQDLMSFVDCNYRYRMVNDAYAQRFGKPKTEILGFTTLELMGSNFFYQKVKPNLDKCFAGKEVHFQEWAPFADDQLHFVDIVYYPYRDKDGTITGAVVSVRDITSLKQAQEILTLEARRADALLALPAASVLKSESEFLQYGQELIENLTGSEIAFVHFVSDEEKTIELVTWSRRTLEQFCTTVVDTHSVVEKAGMWADAIRQRQPFVMNNYEQCLHKLALPEGHAALNRFISVPVIEDGKVVMLTGVGNKPTDYTDLDIETVQLLSNEIWRIAQNKRTLAELADLNKDLEIRVRNRTRDLEAEIIQRKASEHRYQQVVSKMSDGVAIYEVVDQGADFILRAFNHAAEKICDRTWGQVVGRPISTGLPGFKDIGLKTILHRVWQSGAPEYLPEAEYQDERVGFWMESYIFRLSDTELVAIFKDISHRREAEQQLEHIAYYDSLTGLSNRSLLLERLSEAMVRVDDSSRSIAVVYLDLDGFKAVNDTYGHKIGDELLKAVSQRMQRTLRQKDTLARIGGDEFVALLTELDVNTLDLAIFNRLLDAAAQPVQIGSISVQVSASLGVTFYSQRTDLNADQLLMQADRAMYHAKEAGKNRCYFCDAKCCRDLKKP
jgi:diguanylate cyclase (GGDEF)-like protein/PAS domain S-box-containing protein